MNDQSKNPSQDQQRREQQQREQQQRQNNTQQPGQKPGSQDQKPGHGVDSDSDRNNQKK